MPRYTLVTLLLILVFSVPSFGWSDTGHMAVAGVAYRRLNPQARARVDALVEMNPRFNIWLAKVPSSATPAQKRMMLFMYAATWADEIKGDGWHQSDGPSGGNRPPTDGTAARNIGYSDRSMHKYWHFIDLPFSTDGTALKNPPVPNAKTQIDAFRAVLASNSADVLKSYDLVWLLHLVGDVHQPLHCAARFTQGEPNGDDGGNSITVCNPQCGKKLHSFWDGLLGTSNNPMDAIAVMQTLPTPPAALANNLDTAVWINEGFVNAKTSVYRFPIGPGLGPFTITSTYRNAARTLAKRRVALAGARLGKLLNDELR
jgi:hypothetical protein